MADTVCGIESSQLADVLDVRGCFQDLDDWLEKDKLLGSKLTWKLLTEKIHLKMRQKAEQVPASSKLNKEIISAAEVLRESGLAEGDKAETERHTQVKQASSVLLSRQVLGGTELPIQFARDPRIRVQTHATKGRGFVAREALPAGTLILAEKPYLGILDVELERTYPEWEDLAGDNGVDTEALACQMVVLDPDFREEEEGGEEQKQMLNRTTTSTKNQATTATSDAASEEDAESTTCFLPDELIEFLHPTEVGELSKEMVAELEEKKDESALVGSGATSENDDLPGMHKLSSLLMSKAEIESTLRSEKKNDSPGEMGNKSQQEDAAAPTPSTCSERSAKTGTTCGRTTRNTAGESQQQRKQATEKKPAHQRGGGIKRNEDGADDSQPDDSDSQSESEEEEEEEEEESVDSALQKLELQQEIAELLEPKYGTRTDRLLLRAKTRLNALGFYTNNEQFSYPLNYQKFQGTGLYLLASMFNHSCSPNVSRFSIGDLCFFVATQDVAKGAELQISYIGHEDLAMDKGFRAGILNRDFVCQCEKCVAEGAAQMEIKNTRTSEQEVEKKQQLYAQVDAQLQAELNLLPPKDAIAFLDELLGSTTSGLVDDAECAGGGRAKGKVEQANKSLKMNKEENKNKTLLLDKDRQELLSTKAIQLIQLGMFQQARVDVFEKECIPWLEQKVSKYDESLVVYHLLCLFCLLAEQLQGERGGGAVVNKNGTTAEEVVPRAVAQEQAAENNSTHGTKKRKVEVATAEQNENQDSCSSLQPEELLRFLSEAATKHLSAAKEVFNVCTGRELVLPIPSSGKACSPSLFELRYKREIGEYLRWAAFALTKEEKETLGQRMRDAMRRAAV
ncbi:unnamed protein product [Amoebophrya sp. A120]|nr:unnamed protein product [Amoebophrya sp. A120]|eukprot:GSA120T00007057001.1